MADLGCCPGTSHCTENEMLKATTEKQRLRIDHQTVEIRVRVPTFSPKPATAVFNEPARRALIVILNLKKTGKLLPERTPCRAKMNCQFMLLAPTINSRLLCSFASNLVFTAAVAGRRASSSCKLKHSRCSLYTSAEDRCLVDKTTHLTLQVLVSIAEARLTSGVEVKPASSCPPCSLLFI